MKRLEIYTDGAVDRVSKRGGWAWVMLYKDELIEKSGAETDSNLNRMKMMAMIHSAEKLMGSRFKPDEATFYSDCEYCLYVFSEKHQAQRRHKNYDLIQRFMKDARFLESRGIAIRLESIKGSRRNPFNDRADAAARTEMAGKPASVHSLWLFESETS
jgi:ribonuclease HI